MRKLELPDLISGPKEVTFLLGIHEGDFRVHMEMRDPGGNRAVTEISPAALMIIIGELRELLNELEELGYRGIDRERSRFLIQDEIVSGDERKAVQSAEQLVRSQKKRNS